MPTASSLRYIALCIVAGTICFAQNSGIQGVVTDSTGGVIPAADVTAVNVATGVEYEAQSNETGLYSVPFLSPGTYSVTATTEGFAPSTRENLKLDVQQIARVDFTLSVGTVAEVVEVSAAAALLESEQAAMGQVIDNQRIVEMPLNKRNYLELAQLSVGILPGATVGAGTRPGRNEAGFVGMGMRGYQNNVMIDGIDNGSRAGGGPLGFEAQASKPSVDAVGEFKVVTNNMSAEYGFRMGPKVLVSIKSGSNELHGSAFEFVRNEKLDATNFFANRSGAEKPTLRQNQFGGTLGGPIIRNKTFGFFSYQGTRIRLGRSFLATVPSGLTRSGDFSMERTNFNQIFDPATTVGTGADASREPFPNNTIPASRFDPVSTPLLSRYPSSNVEGREFGFNNYFRAPSDADDTDQYDFRVDHNVSDSDRVFFRMSIRRQFRVNQSPLPVEAGGQGGQTVDLNGDNLAFNWTHSFSPTLHNEARFGFTHFPTRFDTLIQEPLNATLGIKGAPGDTFGDGFDQGFSFFNINGYNNLGTPCCWPNINNMDNIQIVENLLWQKGNHGIKIGFDYRRLNIFREAMRFRRGQFLFNRVFTAEQPNIGRSRARTGNGLAEMMLGTVGQTRVGNPAGENAVVPYTGIYIQDDWKVTPKLTLTLGVRWELFNRGYYPKGHIPGRTGVSNYITAYNGLAPGEEEYWDRPEDGSDCGCENDRNNFAPRVGFAYRLNEKTVIRASAGLFYGEGDIVTDGSAWSRQVPDFTEIITPTFDNITPVTLVKDGFLPVTLPAEEPLPNTGASASYRSQPTQYASQWFIDIQRELPENTVWIIGYQGSATSFLQYRFDINNPGPHPTIPARARRLRPQRTGVTLGEPGANASYNALVTRLEKRFSKGVTFLTSYTWSHNIDNNTQFLDSGLFNVANHYDRGAERASANIDMTQSFTSSFTWQLPFGKNRAFGANWGGAADAILGGWQIGGLVSLRTGFPFEVTFPGDPQNSGTTNRGNRVGSGVLSNPTIDNWFDQSAFVVSEPGVFGTTGRNPLRGPGGKNFDFMLGKRFRMPWEGHTVQFRFEAFNFTNTPQFGQPVGGMLRAATGTINRAGEPRRIQFGLKYLF
ncbi:MAG: TonB-dependent receptor [Bryobacterales bacterium]|nr:TonB-dependent receptor [Bryobacterales bacterium]MDE0622233.1 TonB-dependent receptor [Bryobacterales bacterium]